MTRSTARRLPPLAESLHRVVRQPRPAARAIALIAAMLGGPAHALLECELPDDRRRLQIEIPGRSHLCEVAVTYQSGERRVLWYADNDTSFCDDKLAELQTKYTEQWGFDCVEWPSDDGIDALLPGQRRALDRALRERLRAGESIAAVRVATAAKGDDGRVLVAVQWLGRGGADDAEPVDALDVFVDRAPEARVGGTADWRPWVATDDLGALVRSTDEAIRISRALLTDIDANGALAFTTVVEALSEDDLVCRGRQRLTLDGDGGLASSTTHRHACEAVVAEAD